MLVYSDLFTNDEVISDSYKQQDPFGDSKLRNVAFEVISKKVMKGNEDFGISANVDEDAEEGATAGGEGDAGGEQVIDIVDAFDLKGYDMSKNDFKTYAKAYIGKVISALKEKEDNEKEVEEFKRGIQLLIKKILEEWDNCEIYFSRSYLEFYCENEAMPIIGYYKGEEISPRFVFIRSGLREVKC